MSLVIYSLGQSFSSCKPSDCQEVYHKCHCTDSGVYWIDVCRVHKQAYCEMNGQWTVFQRRLDGSQDFYKLYSEYKTGFGNPTGEYWLGLDSIHCLTTRSPRTELQVDLADFEGEFRHAAYSIFSVGNSGTGYRLFVGGYTGTAGDAMAIQNKQAFSTRDHDVDAYSGHCAVSFKGGWWYNKCHHSNLNGAYLSGPHTSYADGVNWEQFKGYHYSLKYAAMKLRRV